ncbi:MAG: hypothetical protein QOI66_3614 [Myxococcales bacterium]|jgi:hypothetical protein|nr:hypothetical protein [Myxococcales bacterium]
MAKRKYLAPALGGLLAVGCQVPEGAVQYQTGGAPTGPSADGGSDGGMDRNQQHVMVDGSAEVGVALPMWQEHWFEHNQLIKKVDQDENFVLYFDNDMDPASAKWISPYLSSLWRYTKATYGVPGDQVLYAVFHSGRYMGAHAASIFDSSHDNHNVIDSGGELGKWNTPASADLPTWVAGGVLEGAALGVSNLPSLDLTQAEFRSIYVYDAMKAIGMADFAKQLLDGAMTASSNNPRAGTFWTRDWYFPLWRDHGGAAIFARYYSLLFQHYPKVPRDDGRGLMYAPAMNWGEYIHFMSGAAGTELKTLATKAFGWTDQRELEYQQARANFPKITY